MIFDTHAHLNDEDFIDDLDQVMEKIKGSELVGVNNVGYDYESSVKAVELADGKFYYASIGMHPHDSRDYTDKMEEAFVKLYEDNKDKIVAYGEIGLDYHYDNSPRDIQKGVFIRQLKLAEKLKLPVIIHSRDAAGDTFDILREHLGNNTGIIHSCSASAELAKEYVKMGMYISFSGTLTFKNAKNVRNAAAVVDMDKLLIETDCPYLTPVPFRGKRNDPTYVKYTGIMLADVKGVSVDEMEKITTENAKRFFGIL